MIGVGAVGYLAYDLATGGAERIVDSAGRISRFEGTTGDYFAAGSLLGGVGGGSAVSRAAISGASRATASLNAGRMQTVDLGLVLGTGVSLPVRMAGRGSVTNFEVAEGAAQGASFNSFRAFKSALGPAGQKMHWHHLVEQTPGNLARFGPGPIQNTGNLVRLDATTHRNISGFYSSIQPFSEGVTVRQWLAPQSFGGQQEFGQQILLQFGGPF